MIAGLKNIDQFTDRHGQRRYYVRLNGARHALPEPNNPEVPGDAFLAAYWRAMAGAIPPRIRKVKLQPRDPFGLIYIAGFDRFVKIGFTSQSVAERIRTLSTGSPLPIEVYATMPGRVSDERALHRRFHECRLRGEWFELRGDLSVWVAALRNGASFQPDYKTCPTQVAQLNKINALENGMALRWRPRPLF